MAEITEVIQVIYYILSKIKQANKIKLIKLIYLADKYHLLLYGRTITGDDYYAMEYGPVGSLVKDVLARGSINISKDNMRYAESLFEYIGEFDFKIKEGVYLNDLDLDISESDKQALDFVIEKFGNTDGFKLSDYTHKYPEWLQHAKAIRNGTKSIPIKNEELLTILDDDIFQISKEHVELSKQFISGEFE